MNFKRCKVVMLSTNEKASINSTNQGLLFDAPDYIGTFKHLYILSDDEIQVGDYSITHSTLEEVFQVSDQMHLDNINYLNDTYKSKFKKIIATTDKSLNLPTVSKGFIQKYCELGGIDEVMVKYEVEDLSSWILEGVDEKAVGKDIPYVRNNKISLKAVEKTVEVDYTDFGFGLPMVHHNPLNTWSSSFFVEVNGYIVSFAGDDGNKGKLGEVSKRHYLNISKYGKTFNKELGFAEYDVNFNDFLLAIEKVKTL